MKRCSRCQQTKPLSEFNKKGKGRHQSQCRPCQKTWYGKYYRTETERRRLVTSKAQLKQRNREFIEQAKKDVPCMDCKNIFPPYVMDFDHLEKKSFGISRAVNSTISLERLAEEIVKCDLVCANCHRIRTFNRRAGR